MEVFFDVFFNVALDAMILLFKINLFTVIFPNGVEKLYHFQNRMHCRTEMRLIGYVDQKMAIDNKFLNKKLLYESFILQHLRIASGYSPVFWLSVSFE